jgi:hypothetical protein
MCGVGERHAGQWVHAMTGRTALRAVLLMALIAAGTYIAVREPDSSDAAQNDARLASAKAPEDGAPVVSPLAGKLSKPAPPQAGATVHSEPVPFQWRFPGVDSVASAESFDELIDRYSGEERDLLLNYYGALDDAATVFSSREELVWLVANGFPMPEDVIAAASMSEEALRDLAAAGNAKATFFLIERIADQLGEELAAGRTVREWQPHADGTPAHLDKLDDLLELSDRAAASGSAFAGYLLERVASVRGARWDDGDFRFAALNWARTMGDGRAGWSLMEGGAQGEFGGASPGGSLGEYLRIQSAALRRNPAVLDLRPRFPMPDGPTSTLNRSQSLYRARKSADISDKRSCRPQCPPLELRLDPG